VHLIALLCRAGAAAGGPGGAAAPPYYPLIANIYITLAHFHFNIH